MILDIPEHEYHADHSRDSHSAIEIFLRRRSDYKRWRSGTYKRKGSDEMGFGGYFHALVFEGRAAAERRYLVAPSRLDVGQAKEGDDDAHTLCNRKRKAGKDAWKMFEAQLEREGKVAVMPQDAQRAAAMLDALAAHDEAKDLLFPKGVGLNERTLHFTGPTGRPSKCRIDRLLLDRSLCPDLKTYKPDTDSRRPDTERIVHQANAFGYHRQGAWYLDALYGEMSRCSRCRSCLCRTKTSRRCLCGGWLTTRSRRT